LKLHYGVVIEIQRIEIYKSRCPAFSTEEMGNRKVGRTKTEKKKKRDA
jgi:hypothetical protein